MSDLSLKLVRYRNRKSGRWQSRYVRVYEDPSLSPLLARITKLEAEVKALKDLSSTKACI